MKTKKIKEIKHMKKSNSELKFSALKIKKIIQENKEIGKIANMAPYVICKSLFYLCIKPNL